MDLTTRLRDLRTDHPTTPSQATIDADLDRGRRALVRRRVRRGAGAGVAVLAVAGLATALTLSGPTSTPKAATHQQHHVVASGAIKLVDYTGPQKHGFDVTQIPDGWVLQDSQPGFLTIAPAGSDDHDGASFVNKLVVTLRSIDDHGPIRGTAVTVNGVQGGIVTDDQGVKTLTYPAGKNIVDVQAWNNLHWTDDQLVAFAEGVTVTADVEQSRG